MTRHAAPIFYALFIWWFSTGAVLYLVRLPREFSTRIMIVATAALAGAFAVLFATRSDASAAGAYYAFTAALVVWGWAEIAFLTGLLTGPRKTDCPADARGWARTRYAVETILHHELSLIALGIVVAALTWSGDNRIGLWTFLVLWTMRASAKFNLFLGARVFNEELLPPHLRHLASYFRRAPMNPLMPASIIGPSIAVVLLVREAGDSHALNETGFILIGALLALAVVEHLFMIIPAPLAATWNWGAAPAAPANAREADGDPVVQARIAGQTKAAFSVSRRARHEL